MKNARTKEKSPRTRRWGGWCNAVFLIVCMWHLEAELQTTKCHEGEKPLREISQGHFDMWERK